MFIKKYNKKKKYIVIKTTPIFLGARVLLVFLGKREERARADESARRAGSTAPHPLPVVKLHIANHNKTSLDFY